MPGDIDQIFISQFESEVHNAYQRHGSQLRNFVRRSTKMPGQDITFPIIGKGAAIDGKTLNGDVPTMNIAHDKAKVTLLPSYAADFCDYFDTLRTNVDERRAIAESSAWAIGRRTDQYIITALDGAGTTNADISVNLSAITASTLTSVIMALGAVDVPIRPDRMTVAVSMQVWGKMLGIQEFVNSQWVGTDDLPLKTPGVVAKSWGGALWTPYSGLTIASNVRNCYAWDRMAVGHGVGEDLTTSVDWIALKDSWFVKSKMLQGAVAIDGLGIQRLKVTENA